MTSTYFLKPKRPLLWALGMACLTAFMALGLPVQAQKAGGTLRVQLLDTPPSPSLLEEITVSAAVPFMGVFNNLVIYDQAVARNTFDSIRPELATDWTVSADGLQVQFNLRQGVTWHDGKPFTAADVRCTFDLLMEKGDARLLEIGGTLNGSDIRHIPYRDRLIKLAQLLDKAKGPGIHWVRTTSGHLAKCRIFDRLREERAEGVVFKRIDAAYSPGRPSSGGDQLKYKFVETASVIITGINANRSVQIAVWNDGKLVPAGNVTIPPDQAIPQEGDVVEVRFLYAIPASGSLFQPAYLGVRDDIAASECTRDQRKLRREPEEVAA